MIRNTRPDVLPFVKYNEQSVQDEKAMLTGGRRGDELELNIIRSGSTVYLPSHFLIPLHPTGDNQPVVALEGPQEGKLFKTMKKKESPTVFGISPIAARKRKELAVIEQLKLVQYDKQT
jgi:hypothetical protein